jgi:hypothetical protein
MTALHYPFSISNFPFPAGATPLELPLRSTYTFGMYKRAADAAFVSFCIEMSARENRLSGADVLRQFEDAGVLDYLFDNYEALHTQGWGYIRALIHAIMVREKV